MFECPNAVEFRSVGVNQDALWSTDLALLAQTAKNALDFKAALSSGAGAEEV